MQLIFPSGFAYAVIKMDPLAMVKDLGLDDLDTLAAAAAMKPKKYLVYLEYPLDLPSPKSRWCRYSMSPISSTLRAEDRKNRLLPDMVVPIFPNTQCSSEIKSPVRPTPTFPSSNCFHWMENVTNVRVRRPPSGELFDNARAVSLDAEQHVALQNAFSDEYDRVDGLLSDDSDDSASSASASTSSRAESFPSIPPDALLDPKVLQACSPLDPSSYPLPPSDYTSSTGDTQASIPPQSDNSSRRRVHRPGTPSETDSGSSGSSSEADLKENTSSTAEELYALNLFGWDPDPTVPLIPLVDLWLELEEHVCAEDIPSPVDWYKEEEEIVSIIMEAFTRRSRSTSEATTSTDSSSFQDEEPVASISEPDRPVSDMPTRDDQTARRPRSGKPRRVLQKMGSGARSVFRRPVFTSFTSRFRFRTGTEESRPLS